MGNQTKFFNRRPLFIAAVFLGAGILFAYYTGFPVLTAAVTAAGCVLLSLLLWFVNRRIRWKRLGAVAALFLYAAVFFFGAVLLLERVQTPVLPEKSASLTAHVAELPVKTDYGYTHILDNVYLDTGEPVRGRIRFVSEKEYAYGSLLKISAKLKQPEPAVNPGGYDEKLTLMRNGVYYKAYANSAAVLRAGGQDLYGWLINTRQGIIALIQDMFPKDVQGLTEGMLLGDTEDISDEAYQAFKTAGASHILAVSGLNVSIIIFVFYTLLKIIRVGKRPRYFITLVFILFYAALTGFGASIVRASIMSALFLTVSFFGQKTDPLIVLAASFIGVLALNPLELLMPGFALTFAAVFGMVTVGGALSRAMRKWPRDLRELAAANIGATAGTAPVLLGRFYNVSVISLVGNFFVVPLSTFATILITVAVSLGALFKPLAVPLVYLATGHMRLVANIVHLLSQVPYASVTLGALNVYLMLAAMLWMLFASGFVLVKPKIKKILVSVSAFILVLAMVLSYMPWTGGLYMAFLDVGQGDSAFVRTPCGVCFLVDGGDEYAGRTIESFLDYKGARLDFAVLTHAHDDHYGGILDLIAEGRLKTLYTTPEAYSALGDKLKDADVRLVKAGDVLRPDRDVTLTVLYPDGKAASEDENDVSMVAALTYKQNTCLLTGDAPAKAEESLLPGLGRIGILKAGHHGSATANSEELLKAIKPVFGVISVGKENRYRLPDENAVQRLTKYCGKLYRTDENHAVEFYLGDTITAVPMAG